VNASGTRYDGEGMVIIAEQVAEFGGVERIAHTLLAAYPKASFLAGNFFPKTGQAADDFERRARTLGIAVEQNGAAQPPMRLIGPGGFRSVFLGPVYARRLRSLSLDGASTVVSLGGLGWTLAADVPQGSRHVGYIGGLPRPFYTHTPHYLREHPRRKRPLLRAAIPFLRAHFRALLHRPHDLLTNSVASARGLQTVVERPVEVVYPPARTRFFTPATAAPGEYYLAVSRLYLHKRLDILLDAFRRLPGERLVIAGDGPASAALRAAAPPNVTFVGLQQDDALRDLYRASRAVVSASVEEFGISNAEALACGVPVIAPRAGGSGEIVDDGATGVLLERVGAADVVAAIRRLEKLEIDRSACRRAAERYSEERFVEQLGRVIAPPV
jgi:glycosyltransferase involved in cell wall biosynthesis